MINLTLEQQKRQQLYNIGFIFIVISTVLTGFFLVPLIWTIPACNISSRAVREVGTPQEQNHLTLGILSIFFVGLIGGIFITIAALSFTQLTSYQNDTTESIK